MSTKLSLYLAVASIIAMLSLVASCVHDPIEMDDIDMPPIDTMMVDTMMVDTMMVDTIVPCDPDVVYFAAEVLPILKANCAQSGCHNAASAQDGVILDSYSSVISSNIVKPFDLSDSDLFEVLTETDPSKRMPPPPANQLAADQISLISEWILQGALDLMCDGDTTSGCQTNNVSFAADIAPVINTACRSCHSGSAPAGGIDLSGFAGVQAVAMNGRLIGSIDHQSGFSAMPQGTPKLDDCTIDKFKAWVADGSPNN